MYCIVGETLINGKLEVDQFTSDHYAAVLCRLITTMKTVSYRKIKLINLEHFKTESQSSSLCMISQQLTNTNKLYAYVRVYNTILSDVLNKHSSLKNPTRVTRAVVPWYSDDTDHAE